MLFVCPCCHDFGEEPIAVACDRCGRVACQRCDRCAGCQRIVCHICDSAPTPMFAYPGDAHAHPHVIADEDAA